MRHSFSQRLESSPCLSPTGRHETLLYALLLNFMRAELDAPKWLSLCHMWKPENDPNFFGGRKHMSTMIGLSILWAILGSRVTAAISPTSLCLYVAEQVPRAWLFLLLQPHPNQALPASPTSHTELLVITRACSCCSFWREYLLFISHLSPPHGYLLFLKQWVTQEAFSVRSGAPIEPKGEATSTERLTPLFCKNRASSLRRVSKSQPLFMLITVHLQCYLIINYLNMSRVLLLISILTCFLLSDSNSQI